MAKDKIIAARVDDDTKDDFEEKAWENRQNAADIQRELVQLFLTDEDVEKRVIERLNDGDVKRVGGGST